MQFAKENTKKNKAVAFTKKKVAKPSFKAKIEKANSLLSRAVFPGQASSSIR